VATTAGSKAPVVPWHGIRETPVILTTGAEGFLAERALKLLAERMRTRDPQLEISDLDASSYADGELMQRASPSLFGEPRLIRVSSVEKCTDSFLDNALRYLEAPQDNVVVVLRHGGGNRGKKLLDALRQAGPAALIVECVEIKKDHDRLAFIQAEFSSAGARIAPQAQRALADAFTTDLAELAAACAQLIADAGESEITERTVERYYGGRVEATTFQIVDHAIAGRPAEALTLLRHALHSGVEPVLVVAACAMKLRSMANVGGASGSVDAVASELGLPPWQVRQARASLSGWDESGLGRAIMETAATDAAVKGASRDPHYALERMIRIVAHRGKEALPTTSWR